MSSPPPEAGTPPSVAFRGKSWAAIWPYAAIALAAGSIVAAFAYTAGWLSPERLTPARMVDAIEANGGPHPGFRRAHGKGICVAGYFDSGGLGARLSKAAVLAPGRTPFVGRMSIGGGAPDGPEAVARVRSMSLQLVQADGREWRMAMNSFPVLAVSTPQAFYAQTLAARPDPATGKPDPAKLAAFAAAHPEGAAFKQWADSAPFTDSFANTAYHSVNAFLFENAQGQTRAVRWSMLPTAPVVELDKATRAGLPNDYLQQELQRRLAAGPLRWSMVVTLAAPGDPINDPARAWPESRERVEVGEVVVESAEAQASGACRHINFDPLILPQGVRASDDPILHARSAAYSVSATRRLRETAESAARGATP